MAALVSVMASHGGQAQPLASDAPAPFDIPAQPLADALVAYGAATGLEVFYDGSLAIGRRSAAVKGVFTPIAALQTLLRGTGYVHKTTPYVDTVSVVRAPHEPAAAQIATLNRFEPYFAVIQSRITEVLCKQDYAKTGDEKIMISLWLDPSGVVSRAQVLGSAPDGERRRSIQSGLQGLHVGQAVPAGLPQPVALVIFPPSTGEIPGCRLTTRR